MKTVVKLMGLMMAMLAAMFQPLQITHGADGCCATCQMKREEDDKIEVYEEKEDIGGE